MHRSITTLQAAGMPIREFPQTQANCTLMGQTLFDLLTGLNLTLYPADDMRQQALSTVAVENPRGWRIAKEKASKKIDAIVALSMACVSAMAHRGEVEGRAARGFNRSAHIAKETLTAQRGAVVYLGQTLVDTPASVIVQEYRGTISVLAAFVGEGLSVAKHLETNVKPWLAANAGWALQDRRFLFGAYEELGDKKAEWNFVDILQSTLSGRWESVGSPWESRREKLLDLLGKAAPFSFTPALRISPDARPLIESLSGRWSYTKERRDQRNPWWYVANALTLASIASGPIRKRSESR